MPSVVRFHKVGGPEVLVVDHIQDFDPGPDEVRIKIQAIGLNRAEAMLRQGVYHEQPIFPSRLGYEASGIIEAVGKNVNSFVIGDRIATVPSFALSQTKQGVCGESAVVPAEVVTHYPDSISSVEGAAIWMQYLTAYGALVTYGGLQSKHVVIITAASSSVGIAAIQIAKCFDSMVIATTRYSNKKEKLIDNGADHVIATEEENIVDSVMKITNQVGADLAFDPIAGPMLGDLCNCMANHGRIYEYGALHQEKTIYPLMPMLAKSLSVVGFQVLDYVLSTERFNTAKNYILTKLESGELTPVIDKTFSLENIVDAYRYMESNDQVGKIVVTTKNI